MTLEAAQDALIEIGMPKLSDSMEEATILTWLKRPGERIRRGEPLVEVETDKATVVYEAELDGVLQEIVVDDGATARTGAVIARVRVEGAAAPAGRPLAKPPARSRATPVARRLAQQLGVSLQALSGSGPDGRIVAADVRAAQPAGDSQPRAATTGRGALSERPHSVTQRTIARRMSESRSTIPEFTLEAEIRMDRTMWLRDDLRSGGIDPLPSYNDFVIRAVALALREYPTVNSSYEQGKTLVHGRINIGIAVEVGDDALIVPTVYDADRKTIREIAAESRRLAERARNRSLAADELTDATFTVSNLGMLGVRRFNAVINSPQVAILAVGEVAERPVAENGSIVARTTMEVALSCDHRVVYGAEAARFLRRIRELLEQPGLLIVDGQGG